MNIAFVCNSLTGGGAERFTANISNRFSLEQENCVYVITGLKTEKDYKINSNVIHFDFLTKHLLKDCKLILKTIKEKKLDVIIGVDIYPNFCVSICSIFSRCRCIISERNAPKQVNISKKSRIMRWILYRFADGYVFQTEGAKKFYSRNIQKKSVVIHNPIRENLPQKTNINNKEIVAVGRLNEQKNYPMLLKAFSRVHKKYPDWSLRIFGEGRLKDQLESLTEELNLKDSVIFEGFSLNVHEAIKDSSIFVMTSDYEGMPNSLMEAMAMGFPVVSTDCPSGGPRELIIDGENGLLCEVDNEKDCAEKIINIISNSELRKKIEINSKLILESHNSNYILEKWRYFINGN